MHLAGILYHDNVAPPASIKFSARYFWPFDFDRLFLLINERRTAFLLIQNLKAHNQSAINPEITGNFLGIQTGAEHVTHQKSEQSAQESERNRFCELIIGGQIKFICLPK